MIPNICEQTVPYGDKQIKLNPGHVSIIPSNMEKYKSFTKSIPLMHNDRVCNMNFRFIDSLNFLTSSLEKCASYLSPDELVIMRTYFPEDQEFTLVNQKGIFPYEYVTSE